MYSKTVEFSNLVYGSTECVSEKPKGFNRLSNSSVLNMDIVAYLFSHACTGPSVCLTRLGGHSSFFDTGALIMEGLPDCPSPREGVCVAPVRLAAPATHSEVGSFG